ncbi:MAG TPA: peptidoglycan editing factor PgeF [Thermomicrobiales bacterium]|nr:peptidoglycan editing factor PgeF [Thermomicrobiales bacterium]
MSRPAADDNPADAVPLEPLRFALFAGRPLRHGVTRRAPGLHHDGDISYATGGDPAAVYGTRRRWLAALGADAADVVAARQVHGARVAAVTMRDRGRGAQALANALPETDALVTDAPGLPLLLTYADCTSLLLYDPVRHVAGVAHAGWRGTVADVAGATVAALAAHYGSRPADLLAGIGPAIGPCCYVVGPEVITAWRALGISDDAVVRAIPDRPAQWYFDLPRANRLLLERAGLPPARIEDAAICTACRVADYFSHRAEHGRAGRFAAVIALE